MGKNTARRVARIAEHRSVLAAQADAAGVALPQSGTVREIAACLATACLRDSVRLVPGNGMFDVSEGTSSAGWQGTPDALPSFGPKCVPLSDADRRHHRSDARHRRVLPLVAASAAMTAPSLSGSTPSGVTAVALPPFNFSHGARRICSSVSCRMSGLASRGPWRYVVGLAAFRSPTE